MRAEPQLAGDRESPEKMDWLAAYRQFDEPILFLSSWADPYSHYGLWFSWMQETLTSAKILQQTLRENTIRAYQEHLNAGLPPPYWPAGALETINTKLHSIFTPEFLLNAGSGPYLYVAFEKKSRAAARGRP